MPRVRRSDLPDGAFHVMAHAIEGGVLFRGDADHRMYMGLLQVVCERYAWQLVTFALMGNHVHLLVITTTKQLSAGLWWLHWQYAEYFKAKYRPRLGHVFGGRPKTKPILFDAYFLAVARYIALNPVGVLCRHPEEYHWSAHRAILGLSPPLPMLARASLLDWFGPGDTVKRYRAFVAGADGDEHRAVSTWAAGPPEQRPELEALVAERTPSAYREAHDTWGYSYREIGRVVGVHASTVLRAIARDE